MAYAYPILRDLARICKALDSLADLFYKKELVKIYGIKWTIDLFMKHQNPWFPQKQDRQFLA
jgi:hypothetical protein